MWACNDLLLPLSNLFVCYVFRKYEIDNLGAVFRIWIPHVWLLPTLMQSINRFLYGPTAEEKVRAWQTKLRAEGRKLDREMRQVGTLPRLCTIRLLYRLQLDAATAKARATVKQLATKGDVMSARILAREVVRSNKQKDRLSVSKARLGSIGTQLTQQLGDVVSSVIRGVLIRFVCSDDESYRIIAKVDGNNETIQLVGQAASDQPDDERDVHGNDQGLTILTMWVHMPGLTGHLGWHHGRYARRHARNG